MPQLKAYSRKELLEKYPPEDGWTHMTAIRPPGSKELDDKIVQDFARAGLRCGDRAPVEIGYARELCPDPAECATLTMVVRKKKRGAR